MNGACDAPAVDQGVGWVDADRVVGDLNVAVRTFWFERGRICLGTGGAITWYSDADAEWAKTELKARRLLSIASRAEVPAPAEDAPQRQALRSRPVTSSSSSMSRR